MRYVAAPGPICRYGDCVERGTHAVKRVDVGPDVLREVADGLRLTEPSHELYCEPDARRVAENMERMDAEKREWFAADRAIPELGRGAR